MIIAAFYRTVSTVYILITEKIQKKKTLKAPTPQNGHTQTIRRQIGDELFECV